jgi:hypothetical protein
VTQHPDDAELPELPELSAADDAFVAALLADLPELTMPADVAARLANSLSALASTEPALPAAASTVVPISAAAPATRWRNPRMLQAAAVIVLVVGVGVVGLKVMSSGTSGAPAPAAAAGSGGKDAVITTSGHAYTKVSLASDVQTLVAGHPLTTTGETPAPPPTAVPTGPTAGALSSGTSSPVASPDSATVQTTGPAGTAASGTTTAQRQATAGLVASTTAFAPCLAVIEDGLNPPVEPLAVDAGSYNGQPAVVVVLPGNDDPTSYDVWVVGPTCGTDKNADLIQYQPVPRH